MTDENFTFPVKNLQIFSSPRRSAAKIQHLKRSPSWSPPNITSTPFDEEVGREKFRAENLHKSQKRLFTAAAYDLKKSKSSFLVDSDYQENGANVSKDSGYRSSLSCLNNVSNIFAGNVGEKEANLTKIRIFTDEKNVTFDEPNLETEQKRDFELNSSEIACIRCFNDPKDPNHVERVLQIVSNCVTPVVPERLIGRKIGEIHSDIIGDLDCLQCYSVLQRILSFLDEVNLTRFASVSKIWRKIVLQDSRISSKWSDFLSKKRRKSQSTKENFLLKKEYATFDNYDVRPSTVRNKPLEVLHNLGNKLHNATANFFRRSPNKSSPPSKHDLFVKEAKSLKKGELLMKCPLCQYPAKVVPVMDKCFCTNSTCNYEFCSLCRGPFHSSSVNCVIDPDRRQVSLQTAVAGSEKSKRNLRRLFQ